MDKHYSQLTLKERKEIEAGLDRGDPFRGIASLIGRQPSTVSREVRENRHVRAYKARRSACRGRNWCKRVGVCAECVREGAYCAGCDARDCRDECPAYAGQVACDVLVGAPWVCNGCRKNRYGCNRPNRYVYASHLPNRVDARHFCLLSALFHCLAEITIANGGDVHQILSVKRSVLMQVESYERTLCGRAASAISPAPSQSRLLTREP